MARVHGEGRRESRHGRFSRPGSRSDRVGFGRIVGPKAPARIHALSAAGFSSSKALWSTPHGKLQCNFSSTTTESDFRGGDHLDVMRSRRAPEHLPRRSACAHADAHERHLGDLGPRSHGPMAGFTADSRICIGALEVVAVHGERDQS